jgi:hypothetical protein
MLACIFLQKWTPYRQLVSTTCRLSWSCWKFDILVTWETAKFSHAWTPEFGRKALWIASTRSSAMLVLVVSCRLFQDTDLLILFLCSIRQMKWVSTLNKTYHVIGVPSEWIEIMNFLWWRLEGYLDYTSRLGRFKKTLAVGVSIYRSLIKTYPLSSKIMKGDSYSIRYGRCYQAIPHGHTEKSGSYHIS